MSEETQERETRSPPEWYVQQQARADALEAARNALTNRGLATSSGPSPDDLIQVATWVYTGANPFVDAMEVMTGTGQVFTYPRAGDESVSHLPHRHHHRPIEDATLPDPEGPDYNSSEGDEEHG